jgi:hypothetical protein
VFLARPSCLPPPLAVPVTPQNQYAVYDTKTCMLLGLYVALNTGLLLMLNILSESSQTLCQSARSLGFWNPVGNQKSGLKQWTPSQDFPKGTLVTHNKKVFVGSGENVIRAEPGDYLSKLFYHIFRNPKQHSEKLVVIQVVMCVSQLLLLLLARRRDAVIGWGTMLLFSYAVLYKALSVRRKIVSSGN